MMSALDKEASSDDLSVIVIPDIQIDPDQEQIFNNICYYVRKKKEQQAEEKELKLPPNYAADLINEIQRRRSAGDLKDPDFHYCLKAAQEILSMELILYQSQFETMH